MFWFQTRDVSMNLDTAVESSFLANNNNNTPHAHPKNSYLPRHTFGPLPKLVRGFHLGTRSQLCNRHETIRFSNKCQAVKPASTSVLFTAWLLRSTQVPGMEATCKKVTPGELNSFSASLVCWGSRARKYSWLDCIHTAEASGKER